MKSLPPGNYALSIAHPGHELRLHGFLEKVKPFVFIMCDNTPEGEKNSKMFASAGLIKDTTGRFTNIKSVKINQSKRFLHYYDIIDEFKPSFPTIIPKNKNSFSEVYIQFLIEQFIEKKIDYVVAGIIENKHTLHDACRKMTETAIKRIKHKTKKEIILYEFNIDNPIDYNMNGNSIKIELDKELSERKVEHITQWHSDVFHELKQNITVDINFLNQVSKKTNALEEIKKLLMSFYFFKYEYLKMVKND